MKRLLILACLFGLCCAPASLAQRRGRNVYTGRELTRRDDGRLRPRVRRSPIRALLLSHVDKILWDEAPLREVFDWLRAQAPEGRKVNVVVKWPALGVESIDQETPVTLNMEDTTVAEVLDEILEQVTDLDPITYIGIHNKLRISTKSDFDRKLYTRVYNIDDIFFKIRNFTGSPQIDLNQQQQQGGGSGGSNGQANVQSIFGQSGGGGGNDDDDDEDEDDDEREEEILEWIRTTIEPDSWQATGGLGTLAVFNKMLTVRNTLDVHELLGGPFNINE